jgi:hypothetical protein
MARQLSVNLFHSLRAFVTHHVVLRSNEGAWLRSARYGRRHKSSSSVYEVTEKYKVNTKG